MRQPEILKRLVAFLNDIGNNDQRTVVENLQNSVQYMEEKLRIYEEILNKETGRKKPQLDEAQKRRLAQAGARLNAYICHRSLKVHHLWSLESAPPHDV